MNTTDRNDVESDARTVGLVGGSRPDSAESILLMAELKNRRYRGVNAVLWLAVLLTGIGLLTLVPKRAWLYVVICAVLLLGLLLLILFIALADHRRSGRAKTPGAQDHWSEPGRY